MTAAEAAALWYASERVTQPLETAARPIAGAIVESTRTYPGYYHGNRVVLAAPPDDGALSAWLTRASALFAWRRAAYPATVVWCDALDVPARRVPEGVEYDAHTAMLAPDHPPEIEIPAGFTRSYLASDADWRELADAEIADKPQFGGFNEWRVRTHRLRVERGDGVWCVLRDRDGTLAASAGLFERDGVARFASVLTPERYRRRGLMRALLASLVRESRAPADRTVIVTESGSAAEALYRSLGFRPFASPRAALVEQRHAT